MIGREGPGPERPGPDYPPEWDLEPAEEERACHRCERIPQEGEQHAVVVDVEEQGDERVPTYACLDAEGNVLEEDPEPECGQEEGPHFTACYSPDPWAVQGPVTPPPF